jgi:hypothetical protein
MLLEIFVMNALMVNRSRMESGLQMVRCTRTIQHSTHSSVLHGKEAVEVAGPWRAAKVVEIAYYV